MATVPGCQIHSKLSIRSLPGRADRGASNCVCFGTAEPSTADRGLRSASDVAGGNGRDVTVAVKLVIGLIEAGAGPGFQDAVDVGECGTIPATKGANRGVGVGDVESLQVAGDLLGIPIDRVSPQFSVPPQWPEPGRRDMGCGDDRIPILQQLPDQP